MTLVLSVLAITLTQMVLNQQRLSERALHMKIDELVFAMKGARDEIAGIEGKTEEELEALRRTGDIAENVLEARHHG
ncbi:low affinity iron permease family protein [Sphingomonas sp. PAMC 26605]|uniref:low affinity iron permease family protein n=1 Tax=Sphingomonas sp. PAMC 26605 TaxID=1112214 RepID=UPI00026CB1E7|nr:low affinity iron permease family protein [Sphingomonas sp. PAMC 26605]